MKDQILSLLPPCHPWGEHLHCYERVESTNTLAKAMALQGAPHGTVLIADHQTGGKGRRGRSFHSPAGTGIYFSVVLRPNCQPEQLMHLTCAAAVAMRSAIEKVTHLRAGIKWTNDLVYGQRKLAGILTELGFAPDGTVSYAVIGIGINCNQAAADFPPEIRDIAGSLAMAAGHTVDRATLSAAMMEELFRMDAALLTQKDAILDAYRRYCITLGREVSIHRPGAPIRYGRAIDIDEDGALVVEFAPGQREAVNSGEVSVRGMYGYV